jgi:hypothetical protein
LWPAISIAVFSGTPKLTRFLTAVRRKSCGMRICPWVFHRDGAERGFQVQSDEINRELAILRRAFKGR